MNIVRQLDEHSWRNFVDNHPQGQIFHTPEMFQVFAQTAGYRPNLWAAVDDNNHPLALLLPVEITLMGGPLRWLTSRAVAYGSVLGLPGSEGERALEALLDTYKREVERSILFTELRNLSDWSELQPVLNKCDFTYEEHLNFLLDLTRPTENIWKDIRSNARRNVRKARKSDVVIQEANTLEQIHTAYALLESTYKRLQVPLAPISLFRAALETLVPRGMFKVLVAQVEDVDIGVLTLLLYKDIVYYWYAGVTMEHASYRASDLLVWHVLEWGSQNGFRVLDFGGAGKPDEEYGVRRFKAKYRGELVNYGRNIYVHSKLRLQLSQIGYSLYRKFL
jgi:lipid II:glycine glycyltransferase (peptidoglycan interpeptide bridge formation enzyme)